MNDLPNSAPPFTSPPPASAPAPASAVDTDHLNALAIAHYVIGGLGMLFGLIPLVYVGLGFFFALAGPGLATDGQPGPPAFLGVIFALIGGFFFLLFQAVSICIIISGRCLHKRRRRTFSFVIACIACAWMPFGTLLGVFTLIVLSRESVKHLYAAKFPSAH